MDSELKVQLIQKETITPSSTTPPHLKTAYLSVFDQLSPDVYIPLLLFYPSNNINDADRHSLVAERSNVLKKSLSAALIHFYPFAGEIKYNVSIRCNDRGAAFLEAQVNCSTSKILDKPEIGILKQLLPTGIGSTTADTGGYLLLVQANFFECGGLAIAISSSHIITDAYTLSTFVQSWAETALICSTAPTGDHHIVTPGKFGAAAALFPPLDALNSPKPALEFSEEKCRTKRFLFDASKIATLKARAAGATVPNPTRVEVVSALIWKCGAEASRSNLGCVRPSVWSAVVNIRKILVQPLEGNLMGNLVGLFAVETEASEVVDVDIGSLVAKLREGVEEFKVKYGNGVSGEEACEFFKEFGNLMKRDVDNYNCSSWCRFPFYETNFGWGNPLWVCQCTGMKNLIVLMDTRDGGGIEASLTFNEEDMAAFESNKELLEHATVNPTII